MNFNNRFGVNNGQSQQNQRSSNSGLNFEFPSINLDLNSITEALNPRNFNIVSNLEDLMSSTKCGNRIKDTSCQSCGLKFSLLKRKRTCFDCNMDFCNQCLNKDVGYDRKNHCKRCVVFSRQPLDRNGLNSLRSRDLKWFLASKRVPSQMCNEKGELIDLILLTFSPQTNPSNSGEYNRRFDNYVNTERNEGTGSERPTVSPNHSPNNESISATNVSNDTINSQSNEVNVTNDSQTEVNIKVDSKDNSKIYFNVDDIKNVEQLKELSVKQLKLILTRNFIDYKGCVEKEELLSKAERLWNDRHENKQNIEEIADQNLCKICMESAIDCVLLECGHMISCTNCGKRLSECPICRQYVVRAVHIFKS